MLSLHDLQIEEARGKVPVPVHTKHIPPTATTPLASLPALAQAHHHPPPAPFQATPLPSKARHGPHLPPALAAHAASSASRTDAAATPVPSSASGHHQHHPALDLPASASAQPRDAAAALVHSPESRHHYHYPNLSPHTALSPSVVFTSTPAMVLSRASKQRGPGAGGAHAREVLEPIFAQRYMSEPIAR